MAYALRHCIREPATALGRVTNLLLFSGHGLRYRKLEVILTTTIEKLGKAGETVKVAPGHFRNHLMPKMLAVPNIPKYAFLIREQRKLYRREEEDTIKEVPKVSEDASKENKMKEYEMAAKRLNNAQLSLRRLIKVDKELQEPVTKEELVSEVARQLCINIHPDNIHLPLPLSSLGEYELLLRLPREISRPVGVLQWTLRVKIRRK
ncbi:hypothetical protein HPP92_008880 [Vanilla planifolia]|uniref:Large ribosomal subunit protein bL9c n=1 Tax=Vanilla planifolia TaxID=51239 RepID=A0A835R8Y2_VANPL|nr:hypothetical protein HPP92_008880 [Vanilla planifolia]